MATFREARSIAQRLQPESVRAEQMAYAISGIGDAYQKLGDSERYCSAYVDAAKWYEILKRSPIYAAAAAKVEEIARGCTANH
jgi:hypothetical protein